MRILTALFAMILILSFVIDSNAFDGNRKGFTLGAGLGLGLYSAWKQEPNIDESGPGIAGNFVIGYGWNENNIAVWQYNGASFPSDVIDKTTIQFYTGPTWYHYWGKSKNAFFTAAGFWRSVVWAVDLGYSDVGWALLLGGGLDIVKHLQAGAYFSYCWSDNDTEYKDGWHSQFRLLLTAWAF